MRFALFSDIHANWEALQAAAACAHEKKAGQIMVLGDTLGYGANPNECFDWVLKNAACVLMGNHEKAVVDTAIREWFSGIARTAIEWTTNVLDPALVKAIFDLQFMKIDKDTTFVHSSPDNPEQFRYLLSYQDAAPSFKQMQGHVCFIGHTHIPTCFCENKKSADYLMPGIIRLEQGSRYILNPGSVGQPRDKDPRLAFGIYDDQEHSFEIVRIPYDNQTAAAKIRKAGLPAYLADRLL